MSVVLAAFSIFVTLNDNVITFCSSLKRKSFLLLQGSIDPSLIIFILELVKGYVAVLLYHTHNKPTTTNYYTQPQPHNPQPQMRPTTNLKKPTTTHYNKKKP